ncbi:hypothetical protein [Clostridium folliculivorans]|uniref:Uncharacterized protein n=1 Tax=Clostridium folliculivorans TaxID=2886038 RepID=A0A9W6DC67_9CLOT|nr:hypothetical protein [Clostridium folliculivorans]GKU26686.1 hypothetical protein CFOLD11_35130 [Clostridium folliculivorans]GKU28882.1 hypothetical protein CFB3_09880 [Clostridium folliculivorans]
MRLKNFIMIFLLTISMLLISCYHSSDNIQIVKSIKPVLSMPNQIILHNKGKSETLDKNGDNYNKILELTNNRFHDKISTALNIIDDTSNEVIRGGLGVEFIYSKEQYFSSLSEIYILPSLSISTPR